MPRFANGPRKNYYKCTLGRRADGKCRKKKKIHAKHNGKNLYITSRGGIYYRNRNGHKSFLRTGVKEQYYNAADKYFKKNWN